MADEARVVKWLSNQLSHQERQVLAMQAELRSSPMLSRWEDLSADADAMLNPVLLGIRFRIVTIPPPRQRRVMGGLRRARP